MSEQPKRKKAHAKEVDTSNGALFLRIAELERQVKWLTKRLDEVEPKAGQAYLYTMRIGGQ